MTSPNRYDIERAFQTFAGSCGIVIPEPIRADGNIQLFHIDGDARGTKNGRYQVWLEGKNGDGRSHGWVMDFKRGGEKEFWQFYGRDNPPPKERPSAARQAANTGQQVERAAKLAAALSAYQAARPIGEADEHPYLLAKHIAPRGGFSFGEMWCGLRVGGMATSTGKRLTNLLMIPMINFVTGGFCALHHVFGWADSGGRFSKGWRSAAGGVFPIGRLDGRGGPVFVAEGVSTALSAYDSWIDAGTPEPGEDIPSCLVLAAMDCGNLTRQAAGIREHFAGRRLILIQDDDAAGEKTAGECLRAGFDSVWRIGGARRGG